MADNRWPEFENALPMLADKFPAASAATPSIRPMGFLERLIGGNGNIATTDLDNSIHYNAEAGRASGLPPEQLLAHELQHVNQNLRRTLLESVYQRFAQGMHPWADRPDEIDAVAAANTPLARTTDVNLPAKK